MTLSTRNRNRVTDLQTGDFRRWNDDGSLRTLYTSNRWRVKEDCEDVVSKPPRSGLNFYLEHNSAVGGRITRSRRNNTEYRNFIPTAYRDISQPFFRVHASIPYRPTTAYLLSQLILRTNPETASINGPLFLFELRELPSMLRDVGRFYKRGSANFKPSGLAEHYIQQNFGWAPLVSDLISFLTLAVSLEKRFAQFNELKQKGGKTYVRELFKGSSNGIKAPRRTIESLALVMYGDETRRSQQRTWGYVTWAPKDSLPSCPKQLLKLAKRAHYGLNLKPSLLWDAIPWSWLIDYFTNIGDFIEASQGAINFEIKDYAMMEETRTVCACAYIAAPSDSEFGGGLFNTYTTKQRWKPALTLNTKYAKPALSAYQSSILGSLLTIKLLGRT